MSFPTWLGSWKSLVTARNGSRPASRPCLEALEDRWLPSAAPWPLADVVPPATAVVRATQQQVSFQERLTLVSVSQAGAATYVGTATYFGHVRAVLYPGNMFTQYAANGDTASGRVTPASATTGAITITGGSRRLPGATGTSPYVLTSTYLVSTDPSTGVTSLEITGTTSFSPAGQPAHDLAARSAYSGVVPFRVTGGGNAPSGLPVFPGGTAAHDATGTATQLGKYTGEGLFTLLGFTSATTGTFRGNFVFVAANGDRLAFNYGASTPGTFTVMPASDGKAVAQFVAEFTPDPALSTGRFANVTGGSFIMVATTEPFVLQPDTLGYTVPFHYTWQGQGWLEFANGR
jgi:hypothetical protein